MTVATKRSRSIKSSSVPMWWGRTGGIGTVQSWGAWRDRGATPNALRLGVGLAPSSSHGARTIDQDGNTLWHYWAEGPAPENVWDECQAMLGRQDLNTINRRGEHPLHILALWGQVHAWDRWRATHKLPKMAPTVEGDTLLHRAAWSGEPAMIERALRAVDGAALNSVDREGCCALIVALHRGSWAAVELLLQAGADPNVRDARGRTVMHHAAEGGELILLDRLEAWGGDRDWADAQGRTADSIVQNRMDWDPRRLASSHRHWAYLLEQRRQF